MSIGTGVEAGHEKKTVIDALPGSRCEAKKNRSGRLGRRCGYCARARGFDLDDARIGASARDTDRSAIRNCNGGDSAAT